MQTRVVPASELTTESLRAQDYMKTEIGVVELSFLSGTQRAEDGTLHGKVQIFHDGKPAGRLTTILQPDGSVVDIVADEDLAAYADRFSSQALKDEWHHRAIKKPKEFIREQIAEKLRAVDSDSKN